GVLDHAAELPAAGHVAGDDLVAGHRGGAVAAEVVSAAGTLLVVRVERVPIVARRGELRPHERRRRGGLNRRRDGGEHPTISSLHYYPLSRIRDQPDCIPRRGPTHGR